MLELTQTLLDRFDRFHFIETARRESGSFYEKKIRVALEWEAIDLQPESLTIAIT